MTQTTAREIVIGALIFTALLTGLFTMIGSSIPNSSGDFESYNKSMNKFADIKSNTETISESTEEAEPDEGPEGILSGLYTKSFGALRNAWNVVGVLGSIIDDFSEGSTPLKIPLWFTALLGAIITTTLAFALISSWRKWYT